MALCFKATEPEVKKPDVGSHQTPDKDVDTHSQNTAPVPEPKTLRELPKVGAVCRAKLSLGKEERYDTWTHGGKPSG